MSIVTSSTKKLLAYSTSLAFLTLVKRSCKQPRKHSKQASIITLLNICFLIDNFDVFINKDADGISAYYTISRQKKIARLFKKRFFKVVITDNILNNTQIFNFCVVDKIKNPNTNKIYEKS